MDQLLSAGVPLPVVSKRLGHADPSITARVYSHNLHGDDIRAAEAWDRLIRRAATPTVAECCTVLREVPKI